MNKLFFVLLFLATDVVAMNTPQNLKAKELWDAISVGDRIRFDHLLSEGVSPLVPYMWNHKDGYIACRLPVVCAISCHQYDMAAKLLETSPENQIDGCKEGNLEQAPATLMQFAATTGSYECIPLLLSHGAIIDKGLLGIAAQTPACSEKRKQEFIKEINRILALKNKPQNSLNKTHIE